MSRKRSGAETGDVDARGADVASKGVEAEPQSKQELQRRMEETRAHMSETVAEIKSVVTHQYEEVKGTVETVKREVGEVLDWRTEFERNPLVWGAGAVSIGILVGFGIAHAFDEADEHGRGRKKRATTGGHIVAELSGFADVVLPTISSKVKEMFGLDLDAYLRAERERSPARKLSAKKPAKKKGAAAKPSGRASAKPGGAKKGTKKGRRAR
jgi:hypothetical protein